MCIEARFAGTTEEAFPNRFPFVQKISDNLNGGYSIHSYCRVVGHAVTQARILLFSLPS